MTRPCLHISKASFSSILDTVKTAVLDLSLKPEKAGVLGEGLTFSTDEQSRAKAAMPISIVSEEHWTRFL